MDPAHAMAVGGVMVAEPTREKKWSKHQQEEEGRWVSLLSMVAEV